MNVLKMKQEEEINLNEITNYIEELKKGLDPIISTADILSEVQKKKSGSENMDQLSILLTDIAMTKSTLHPDYAILASRILVSGIHRNTKTSFTEKMEELYNNVDPQSSFPTPLITAEELQIIKQNKKRLEDAINYSRDYNYDFFSLKEVENTLLTKINNQIIERPQDFLMRVAIGIHQNNIDEIIKTYNYMSEGWFFHFPSYLSEAKKGLLQHTSIYSIALKSDNISSVFTQLNDCIQMAQITGKVGVAIHDVPSNVFTSTLHLFNETVNYLNQEQGDSKRPFTLYLEPWHADVFDFLMLNNDHNSLDSHISNLNCALWIPDLFMERVERNDNWTLMCPSECPGLSDIYGKEFEALYKKYEAEGKGQQTIKAQELWFKILETQIEIGTTRLLFKDQINKTATLSQATIKVPGNSRIRPEHILEKEKTNTRVSISLPKFVENNSLNFERLHDIIVRITTESNALLDRKQNNILGFGVQNIPVQIEVQGLAELLLKLRIPFHTQEATTLNKEIFETIQFAATTASNNLAKAKGICRSREEDSNWKNYFQLDLWNMPSNGRWNWMNLKTDVKEYGLYIPFRITHCPTSKIFGNNESFSPISSYVKTHKLHSRDTIIVNEYLLNDLIEEGLWTQSLLQKIIQHQGSIQNISEIPEHIREVYKTAWEVSQKEIIDRISDRESLGVQPHLMEVFITNPDFSKLTSVYFYSWRKGLNTGISHLRTKIDPETMEFSINKEVSFNVLEMNGV